MKCPVCKTECHSEEVCPECGFDDLAPVFVSKEDGDSWIENVVWPWRQGYWESLDDFEIVDREVVKYHGDKAIVLIPYGIEVIGRDAFDQNQYIREVYFSDTVKTVCTWAFYGSSIRVAKLSNSLNRIEASAFSDTELSVLVIPANCVEIEDYAFSGCYNLKTVYISNGVERIGEMAFSWCSEIESIVIPASIMEIGVGAFSTGSSSMEISVDPRNTRYYVKNGCLIDSEQGKIVSGTLQTEIPSHMDIRIIGERAYLNNERRKKALVIPPNITTVEKKAFSACKVTKVFIPKTVKDIGRDILFRVKDCAVFCEAQRKPVSWDTKWCGAKKSFISWENQWKIVDGNPEIVLLENREFLATMVSYSYDESENQLTMRLRFTNRSDVTARFVVSKMIMDEDPCQYIHWGTIAPGDTKRCRFEYEDSEFENVLISSAETFSLEISVKDEDDQYEFAKGEQVTFPWFARDIEVDDELPY